MLDMSRMVSTRKQYEEIILELIPLFDAMYHFPYFEKRYPSKLPTPTRINCGDCFVMALLVHEIAKSRGLNPTLCAGGWHVWVMEAGFIFDSYFPGGITKQGVAKLRVNVQTQDDDPNEPVFYQGSKAKEGDYSFLNGYFENSPSRGYFVYGVLSLYGLKVPVGLNKFVYRRKLPNFIYTRDISKAWVTKRRRLQSTQHAMKRFVAKLRNQHEETRLRLCQPG